ncbi:hypothetical protein Harman_23810 [Haloarcula mannanilytica]|uniref:Uncharacterized protein n=1 Tax=Haloarcula mannanilytica TaxID=2509225 RepID=A0A4C2EJB2_9EURY|nr:hypothetical protein [Haloarcula mannanilytica]GCF14446.1 hypothetical protein Harman_23810 [Haloarcula mannanilytica]
MTSQSATSIRFTDRRDVYSGTACKADSISYVKIKNGTEIQQALKIGAIRVEILQVETAIRYITVVYYI